MLSQPAARINDDKSPEAQTQIQVSRQESDSSSNVWSFKTEFKALREAMRRLEHSRNRPQWWSSHIQGSFR